MCKLPFEQVLVRARRVRVLIPLCSNHQQFPLLSLFTTSYHCKDINLQISRTRFSTAVRPSPALSSTRASACLRSAPVRLPKTLPTLRLCQSACHTAHRASLITDMLPVNAASRIEKHLEDEAIGFVGEGGDEAVEEGGHAGEGPELLAAHAEGLGAVVVACRVGVLPHVRVALYGLALLAPRPNHRLLHPRPPLLRGARDA